MNILPDEINEIREKFQVYLIKEDMTLQEAADLVGWKKASSVQRFLNGKVRKPPLRRLYRIKKLLEKRPQGCSQAKARG